MDPLETVALVRQKRGLSQLPNPMFIAGGENIPDPPEPEMSPEEAAIMDQFREYQADGDSDDARAPVQAEPAGHVSPPSPLIPPQFRPGVPIMPEPTKQVAQHAPPPLEVCVMNNIGTVFDQGTELTPDDVAAIKLVILRRASTRLQEQIQQVERPKAHNGKVAMDDAPREVQAVPPARKRGRPKGSRNKPKEVANALGRPDQANGSVPDAPAGEVPPA